MACFLAGRYLSSEDQDFVQLITHDIYLYLKNSEQIDSKALVFPPILNYYRFLIHKTIEDFPSLHSFSIGDGDERRTVITTRNSLLLRDIEDKKQSGLSSMQNQNSSFSKKKRPDKEIYVVKASRSKDQPISAELAISTDVANPNINTSTFNQNNSFDKADDHLNNSQSLSCVERNQDISNIKIQNENISNSIHVFTNGFVDNIYQSPISLNTEMKDHILLTNNHNIDNPIIEINKNNTISTDISSTNSIELLENMLDVLSNLYEETCDNLDVDPLTHNADTNSSTNPVENLKTTANKRARHLTKTSKIKKIKDDFVTDNSILPNEIGNTFNNDALNLSNEYSHQFELNEKSIQHSQPEKNLLNTDDFKNPICLDVDIKPKDTNKSECSDDSWNELFDENGDSLILDHMKQICDKVGNVTIQRPSFNYLAYQPREIEIDDNEYGHLLEIYDFPVDVKSEDIHFAFSHIMHIDFEIKWVDDTHAILVFSSISAAKSAAYGFNNPMMKLKPISCASRITKLKVKKFAELLQPHRTRPVVVANVARNMVANALGIRMKVDKEKQEKERKIIKDARESKKALLKTKQLAWDGFSENS